MAETDGLAGEERGVGETGMGLTGIRVVVAPTFDEARVRAIELGVNPAWGLLVYDAQSARCTIANLYLEAGEIEWVGDVDPGLRTEVEMRIRTSAS